MRAMGKPVAFEASAELRDHPRIHLDDDDASGAGSTPNWMFDPPVSTPMARITLRAMSRISWYSDVAQRLRRRDGDRVAGVHAHRVHVLESSR